MNIENHFKNTEAHLEMAKEKVRAQDYDSALAALSAAWTDIRRLIVTIYEEKCLESANAESAQED